MSSFNSCRILLLGLSIFSALSAGTTKFQVCNFKDIEVTDVEITNILAPMDKRKTYMDVVDKNGRNVINGTWTFMRDLPLNTEFKWEVYALEEGNRPIRRAQGTRTTLCSFIVKEKPLADLLLKHSDLPPVCPIKKGSYKIHEAGPDLKAIPCSTPGKADFWELRLKFSEALTRKTILEVVQKSHIIRQ